MDIKIISKQTDFTQVKRKQIRFIQDRLNNRPRKSLGFKTPAQVFYARVSKVMAAQLGGNCIYWLNGRRNITIIPPENNNTDENRTVTILEDIGS